MIDQTGGKKGVNEERFGSKISEEKHVLKISSYVLVISVCHFTYVVVSLEGVFFSAPSSRIKDCGELILCLLEVHFLIEE